MGYASLLPVPRGEEGFWAVAAEGYWAAVLAGQKTSGRALACPAGGAAGFFAEGFVLACLAGAAAEGLWAAVLACLRAVAFRPVLSLSLSYLCLPPPASSRQVGARCWAWSS